ncbi:hypothetical protein GCM10010399_51480 [Dactylosporangium fulvum]
MGVFRRPSVRVRVFGRAWVCRVWAVQVGGWVWAARCSGRVFRWAARCSGARVQAGLGVPGAGGSGRRLGAGVQLGGWVCRVRVPRQSPGASATLLPNIVALWPADC